MEFSPLQPTRLYVEEASIKTNREYRPPEGVAYVPRVGVTIGINEGVANDGTLSYRCALRVQVEPAATEQTLPYEIDVHVVGLFAFVHLVTLDKSAMQRMIALSGTTMLYAFARDAVMHQTALGEYGPFVIPAINVMSIDALVAPLEGLRQDEPTLPEVEKPASARRSARRKKNGDR